MTAARVTDVSATGVDVAIVGYGPVGQAMAIALAQRGLSVAVVERWASLYALPRAVTYDHESARILQSLGVAEAMASKVVTCHRYEWHDAQGRALLSFDGMDRTEISGWPDKVSFCQPDLEGVLDARVRSFGDRVRLLRGWELTGADDAGDRVRLTARHAPAVTGAGAEADAEADTTAIDARYVVGCDGAGSFVRQVMGSAYEDLGFSADWLVVDVKPRDPAAWTPALTQICDPSRPTTDVSGGPGRRRLEFMLLPGEGKSDMNTPEAAWRLLAPIGWWPENAELERHAVYTFRGTVADRWGAGRFLLAGDAAHLTPPFAGQGLCAGLRDVAALAWRLDLVLAGKAPPTLLESYGDERSVHVRRFTEFAIALGRVICVLDPAAAAGRDAHMLGPGAKADAKFPDSGLPASALVRADDAFGGALALQARVGADGRVGRFDDVVTRGFVLLGLDHDPTLALSPAQHSWLRSIGGFAAGLGDGQRIADTDGHYRRWFDAMAVDTVLVRPDFYLFGAAPAPVLVDALKRQGGWISETGRA